MFVESFDRAVAFEDSKRQTVATFGVASPLEIQAVDEQRREIAQHTMRTRRRNVAGQRHDQGHRLQVHGICEKLPERAV